MAVAVVMTVMTKKPGYSILGRYRRIGYALFAGRASSKIKISVPIHGTCKNVQTIA